MKATFKSVTDDSSALTYAIESADVNAIADIFRIWRAHPQSIDVTGAIDDAVEAVGVLSDDDARILHGVAELAAEFNANPYHNNPHFFEVFTLVTTLGLHALREERISVRDLRNLMIAALLHDYKHDGTTNRGVPFRLEKLAFESAENTLVSLGVESADREIIRALIYATDVSKKDFFDPDDVSPAESMKYYAWKGRPNTYSDLDILVQAGKVESALILQDADLTSLLAPDLCEESGRALAKERGEDFEPQKAIGFFLDKICLRRASSISGMVFIQPCINALMMVFGLAPSKAPPALTAIS